MNTIKLFLLYFIVIGHMSRLHVYFLVPINLEKLKRYLGTKLFIEALCKIKLFIKTNRLKGIYKTTVNSKEFVFQITKY